MADYAITSVARRVVYTGSAGVGPYAFSFPVLVNTDIAVYKNDTLLTLTTDYTVTISGTTGTGSITLVVAATGADRITIVGARPIQRSTDFVTGGDFFANTLNTELDSEVIFVQQVAETAERSIKAPVTDPTSINMTLPVNTARAGNIMAFDNDGNPIMGPSLNSITTVTAQSANINTVAGSITNVNTVATNITNVNAVAGVSANVTTVAGSIANVNTVASDLNEAVSEINTVAVDIANVNTVGTNIANVNTVAGVSSNVTTVAGISANVTTVAGISSAVSNVSSISSAVTGVNANATDISAVNANKTNIDTVAGISANVTTVAGISANVTSVAGNATNINTVATDIANVNAIGPNIADVTAVATDLLGADNIGTVATDLVGDNNISAVGGSISSVNSVAANSTNIDTVAINIDDVNTVANAILTSFGEASLVSYTDTSSKLGVFDVQAALDKLALVTNFMNVIYAGQCSFVDIKDCTFTTSSGRFAYASNSTNSGNNTGWTFV
jgi:hypothetical protein